MEIQELTAWLNAVIDAQVSLWNELPEGERDEAWGFMREWIDQLQEAAWEVMGVGGPAE